MKVRRYINSKLKYRFLFLVNKAPYIHKQTCSLKFRVCLSMGDLLMAPGVTVLTRDIFST